MFYFLMSLSLWASAQSADDRVIRDFLNRLQVNPKATVQAAPEKWGAVTGGHKKSLEKPRLQLPLAAQTFADMDQNNQLHRFYPEGEFEAKFAELTDVNHGSGDLGDGIWSGDYWATYRMGIASRYGDEDYPDSRKYDDYIDYFKNLGPIDFTDPDQLKKLSPAEKYDLLMLDEQMTMTNWSLFTSRSAYLDHEGKESEAQTWVGLCHGWAPAAYRVPRPLHSVKLPLSDELEIEFSPSDIKALVTLLWARSPLPSRFLGGRCDTKDPEEDELGRVKDPECFDINPASWHTILVNQMSIKKQSFVFDATYDLEVWNQPVKSYRLVYFNPKTQTTVAQAEQGLVPLAEWEKDTFKAHRSTKSVFVVGVMVEVTYLVETDPTTDFQDSPKNDATQTVRYFYDLELDAQKNLVGGEWYHKAHPDFVWTPLEDMEPKTWYDQKVSGRWLEGELPPEAWRQLAPKASREGFPLSAVVRELVRRSRVPLGQEASSGEVPVGEIQ